MTQTKIARQNAIHRKPQTRREFATM